MSAGRLVVSRKNCSCLWVAVAVCAVFAQSQTWGQAVREVTELTAGELDLANGLCREAMKRELGKAIIAWYNTTYYRLPTSDESLLPDPSTMRQLARPVSVSSATGIGWSYRFEELRTALKKAVDKLEASDGSRKCRVSKALVLLEPGGGGGSLGMQYDKITIIPYQVVIY